MHTHVCSHGPRLLSSCSLAAELERQEASRPEPFGSATVPSFTCCHPPCFTFLSVALQPSQPGQADAFARPEVPGSFRGTVAKPGCCLLPKTGARHVTAHLGKDRRAWLYVPRLLNPREDEFLQGHRSTSTPASPLWVQRPQVPSFLHQAPLFSRLSPHQVQKLLGQSFA